MESFGAVVTSALICLLIVQTCQAAQSWSYEGQSDGKAMWATNYPGQCDGRKQSPINLESSSVRYDKALEAFTFAGFDSTTGVTWTLSNNGHTVQVTYTGGTLTVDGGSLGDQYQVAQFHFHWGAGNTLGSEHTVNGQAYPMEVHIVCFKSAYGNLGAAVSKDDGLAVLGFFFEIAPSDNPTVQKLVDHLDKVKYAGDTSSIPPFALDNLMAGVTDYYRYQGGLTTPPCSEVVTWTVFKEPILISDSQMSKFRELMDSHNHTMKDNFRDVQTLYDRPITASFDNEDFAGGSSGLGISFLVLLASLLLTLLGSRL